MEKYLPKMYKNMMNIYQNLDTDLEEQTINEQYKIIDGISVDFGIMQKTRKCFVVRSEFEWDDIGSFTALARFLKKNSGNNVSGNTFMKQSVNCSVFADSRLVIGFGIKDLVIVDAGDVLLVMDKNKDQEVKHLVDELKEQKEKDRYI